MLQSFEPTVRMEREIASLIFFPVQTISGVVIEKSATITMSNTKAQIMKIKLKTNVAMLFFVIVNQSEVTNETETPKRKIKPKMEIKVRKLGITFSLTLLRIFVIWNFPVLICLCIVPIIIERRILIKSKIKKIAG